MSEEGARAASLQYKENSSVSPDVCASHRWLCFSEIDDGDDFCCDLLWGDFPLGLCSIKVLLVSVFVACLTS